MIKFDFCHYQYEEEERNLKKIEMRLRVYMVLYYRAVDSSGRSC